MTGDIVLEKRNGQVFITRADPETTITLDLLRSFRDNPHPAVKVVLDGFPQDWTITFAGVNQTVTYRVGEYDLASDTFKMILLGDPFPRYRLEIVPWRPA